MSGHPQGDHYDDGYGHAPQGHDSYYQDDQNQGYYDQHQDYQQHPQGGDGYYDESYVFTVFVCSFLTYYSGYYNADANNPYQQDGGYYEGHDHQGYQDEYYNDQYYDQGAPATGQQQGYGNNRYVILKSLLILIGIDTCQR